MLPEPFFQEPAGSIYNMDCVAGMNEIADNWVNLLVTSPPYAVGKEYEKTQSFGDYLKLIADFTQAAYRIIKPGGYMVINYADYYHFDGPNSWVQPLEYLYHIICERSGWQHTCTRVWKKDFATLEDPYSISTNLPKLECEHISFFRKPMEHRVKEIVREQDLHPRQVWDTTGYKQAQSTLKKHKAAYPEILMTFVFRVYAEPGYIVVDPFTGSGTTPFVAKKMGIKYIGFEKDKHSCEWAKQRLTQMVFDLDDSLGQRMYTEEEILKQEEEKLQQEHIDNGNKVISVVAPEDF